MTRAKVITIGALALALVAVAMVVLVLRARLGGDGDDRRAIERAALAAQAEAEAARMQATEAARAARAAKVARGPGVLSHQDVIAQLLGEQRATVGPVQSGLRLGMSAPVPATIDDRLRTFVEERGGTVAYEQGTALEQVTIDAPLEPDAARLIEVTLAIRWGEPRTNTDGDLVWLDDALGARMSMQLGSTRIVVVHDRHLSADALVAPMEPTRLGFEPPAGLIGRPIADVVTELGPPLGSGPLPGQPGGANARPVEWERATFGIARAGARLRLETDSGGAVRRASYVDAEAACGELNDLLERKHGKPIWIDDGNEARSWALGDQSINLLCSASGATELAVVGR